MLERVFGKVPNTIVVGKTSEGESLLNQDFIDKLMLYEAPVSGEVVPEGALVPKKIVE